MSNTSAINFSPYYAFLGDEHIRADEQFYISGKADRWRRSGRWRYDIAFKLYEMLANGTQIGTDVAPDNVPVSDGV